MLRLRHPFGLIRSLAVELGGGMCVSLHNGWRALLGEIACAAVGGSAQPRRRRSVIYKSWRQHTRN